MEIKNKSFLVTGANRGIGKAIALKLLEEGAIVHAGARDTSKIDYTHDNLKTVQIDITNKEDIEKLKSVEVDVLINNAGVFKPGNTKEGLVQGLDDNLTVNLYGVINTTLALLPNIKEGVLTVGSMVSFANMPMGSAYSISKAAVHSFIQDLRAEKPDIFVAGIYPGPIETDMTKGFDMEMATPEHVAEEVIKGIKENTQYIFPDPMSKHMGELYLKDPRAVEKGMAEF